ncbi:hypothetical protein GCM10010923_16120 [Blastomonas marina]|uniref:Lipoprotein n=1 Tax=Blastomonas marina TaxID=1867408 RepID=A0ABQ1FDP1_9SPHN|nr:hypothetical protein [Blastomonas marina]GGA06933.1 hypothetical protein GCM10010923_16120 [Blastomonas marina]
MMKTPALFAAALVLAISGCDAAPDTPVDGDIPAADNAADSAPPADEAGNADSADALRAIPARFLGAWDYVEGNCDPTSDLRMEIGQRRIVFYESVGDVTGIRAEGEDAIVVDMNMSGEGETWTQSTKLTLEDGGDRLVPSEAGDDGGYEPMPRKRCAA